MFIVRLFVGIGYKQNSLVDEEVREPVLRSGHVITDSQFSLARKYINEGYRAVIPVRHPYLVAESWERRGKPLEDMKKAYRRLPELLDMGAYPVPMDVIDRDEYLNLMKSELNVQFDTKWPIVNSKCGTYGLNYRDIRPQKEVVEFAEEMSAFLSRFYR